MLGTLACFSFARSVLCSLQIDLSVGDTEKILVDLHVPESDTATNPSKTSVERWGFAERNRMVDYSQKREPTQGGWWVILKIHEPTQGGMSSRMRK